MTAETPLARRRPAGGPGGSTGGPGGPTGGEGGHADAGHGVPVRVAGGRCINLRGRMEACDLCVRACHAGAISLVIDGVEVDPERCTGCGACVPACPAGALEHPAFDPASFVARAGPGSARIACAAARRAPDAVAIPCHRMVDARLAATLLAEGASKIVLIGTESCGACPNGDARPALAAARRTLATWFGSRAPRLVAAEGAAPAAGRARAAAERRAFLRRLGSAFAAEKGAEPELEAVAPPPAGGATSGRGAPLPSFDQLLAAVEADAGLAEARPVPYQHVLAERRARLPFQPGAPVGATARSIGPACSGCMVCAELCPTGALAGEAGAGRRAVTFDPAQCTNCTLCLKVCPMNAIAPLALRDLEDACAGRRELVALAEARCGECGAAFVPEGPEEALCPACRNEREMDDEWLAMLRG